MYIILRIFSFEFKHTGIVPKQAIPVLKIGGSLCFLPRPALEKVNVYCAADPARGLYGHVTMLKGHTPGDIPGGQDGPGDGL